MPNKKDVAVAATAAAASLRLLADDAELDPQQLLPELPIAGLQHLGQRHPLGPALHQQAVPRPYPPLEAEREVMRERLDLPDLPPHPPDQELHLGLEIVLDAERQQSGGAQHHPDGVAVGEAEGLEVADLGEQGAVDAGDEEEGGLGGEGAEAEAAEEEEGGGELVGDAGDEEAGAAEHGAAEVREGDVGGAEEEVEDRG